MFGYVVVSSLLLVIALHMFLQFCSPTCQQVHTASSEFHCCIEITSDIIIMNHLMCWSVLLAAQLTPVISGWPKPVISSQLTIMTVRDRFELYCDLHHPYDKCHFNSSSQAHSLPADKCGKNRCTTTVSGAVLLMPNAGYKTQTHISCGYTLNGTSEYSDNITVVVFNFDVPMKYTVIALAMSGLTILLSFCITVWGCYILISNLRNKTPSPVPQRYQTQQMDMDQRSNCSYKEGPEGQTNEPDDSLCYATVRHPCDVRNSPRVVRFEQCSDYASVIIN
ncbi:hypothetical protein ACEWY4_004157 [Coilia grayii]|uniref:Uncharacterized protein n=1 Tax=Coilia grayii TaxID=363190 RepID=A0ABD1KKV0_9TELE